MTQPSAPSKPESFERNLDRLGSIVSQLENSELTLEHAIQLYEEGMQLSAVCQKQLDEAEGRIEILKKRADGTITAEPFEAHDGETS
jgi:exodeoxyribonuclease VII small subunit